VDKGVWKEAVGENAHEETVGSCDRLERGIYAKKRKSVSFVERRKRGSIRVCEGAAEEGLYLAV